MASAKLASLPRSFDRLRKCAKAECISVTLGQLLRSTRPDPKSLQQAGRWLQQQLPIRVARRVEEILQLPHVVVANPQMHDVLSAYLDTFEAVSEFPEICTEDDEVAFLKVVQNQLAKHNPGTRLLAEGYRNVRRVYPGIQLDEFMHDHFTSRIATRILMDNYVEMRTPRPGFLGVVCQGIRPFDVIKDIASELVELTRSLYGKAPDVEYRGNRDCVLDYIPRHVKYMVRELLKNAFRATVERHLTSDSSQPIPPVAVELQQGDVHVIIKISDQGGGMSKSTQQEAWKYGWTTVEHSSEQTEAWQYAEESCSWDRDRTEARSQVARQELPRSSPGSRGRRAGGELAGYGFGLPLTRLHAQYFGGDLFMQAVQGHGTDLFLILTHLKEGTPSTEIDDLATVLYTRENLSSSI